ncbi:SDR family oxidoreductase [Streptomyces atratus]|uniref:SDR family oxidoreductase n=1 Tax=Streptomyces atratus TaxID=1893 RepID=UPI000DEEC5BA|nr:SDR family oxidoreductase [Streptomyces atratus]
MTTCSGAAHVCAELAGHLRIQGVARTWGQRGAGINTAGPGVISTPIGQGELNGATGAAMRIVSEISPVARLSTPEDIPAAAEFLLSACCRGHHRHRSPH